MVKQKALFLESKQGQFAVNDREVPKPGPGDLLVKVESTALNPVDYKIQKVGAIVKDYPAVLGQDSAGTVEEVGEGVQGFKVGDRVVHQGYFTNDTGTFQQFAVVPADITAKIPPNVSFDEAASIPLTLATAIAGLYNSRPKDGVAGFFPAWEEGGKDKYAGKPIVVFGGATSVGQYVIQLAKLSGFSPIIATASPHNASLLKSLGATHVVDRNANVVEEAHAIVGGKPIDVVYDTVALKSTQELGWDLVAPGGQLILTRSQGAEVDQSKYKDKHVVNVFGNVHAPHLRELGKSLYSKLTLLLEDGTIKPNKVEVVPGGLGGIVDGLKKLENNQVSGTKLVVHPWETA